MHHGGRHQALILLVREVRTHTSRQRHLLFLHHHLKLGLLDRIKLTERIQCDAIGDAVMKTQHHTETCRKGMHHSDVAGRDCAPTQVGRHHQLLAGLDTHHVVGKEYLSAQVHCFTRVRITDGISIRACQRLYAVNVRIHPRIEVLVTRHGCGEIRIEHHLVKHREVAIHAQLQT